mgnify:CR=1 FL=1
MKTILSVLPVSVFAAILLFSCKKENRPSSINYQVKTSNASAQISARTNGGSLIWSSGYASAVEIEFEAESNNVEVEYKSEAKKKIDLFSPLSTLGTVTIPAGFYKDIEFEVEVQANGSDAAFFLGGTYTNSNGVTTPVTFTLNATLEIEAEKENVTITDEASVNALTTWNLSLVTTGVTESMLNSAARTNGTIEISASSNAAIYNIIYNNLRNCGGVEVK